MSFNDRQDPDDEFYEQSKKRPNRCPKCGEEYDYWKGAMCDCDDLETEEEEEEEEEEEPPAKAKRYDPGTPGDILPLGGGCYSVQSFRNRSQRYRVNLRANTCDCPHTEKRDAADCKHRKAARFAAYLAARETAETLTTERLKREFKRNFNRPEIREAIEVELTARR